MFADNVWGFFGVNTRRPKTRIISKLPQYLELENTEDIDRMWVSDDGTYLMVSTMPKREVASPKGSLTVAAFTTAFGRVNLFRKLLYPYRDYACYSDVIPSHSKPSFQLMWVDYPD